MCQGAHNFIPGPGVAKMTLQFTQGGDIAENNIYVHHKDNAAWTPTTLTAMAGIIGTSWGTHLKPYTSVLTVLSNIIGTDLTSHTGPSVSVPADNGGSDTVEALPFGTTFAVKLLTALRGRSYRGRVFQVGLTDRRDGTDQLAGSYAENILFGWNAMLADINGTTNSEQVVFSQCQNSTWLTTGISTPITTAALTDHNIDYQRRRAAAHSRHH